MENNVTISTHNGSQVARQHHLRNPKVIAKEDHIDPNGHFEVWLDEDPKTAYERLFGKSVEEYNERQTREDRKITDYYKQICEDKKKKPVYELIIGIYGKKAEGTPICSKNDGKRILRAFVEDWERRNPQLKLCGLYYHCDESVGVNGSQVGHVHIDYIPVGDGFTRGMGMQSSLSRALEQQGFESQGLNNTAQMQWESRENQFLATLCTHAGFEVIRGNGNKDHLDTATYKKVMPSYAERQKYRKPPKTLILLVNTAYFGINSHRLEFQKMIKIMFVCHGDIAYVTGSYGDLGFRLGAVFLFEAAVKEKRKFVRIFCEKVLTRVKKGGILHTVNGCS